MQISLKNYQNLLKKVQKIIGETKAKIIADINYEKVVMAWQLGKIIEEHLLQNSPAGYGENFFNELEKDISISKKTLYKMRAFYKSYPTLPKKEQGLNWSHYRNLLVVKSDERRKYLEDLTRENNLSSKQLAKQIKKNQIRRNAKEQPKEISTLKVTRGKVFYYKIVNLEGSKQKFLDCGFNIFTDTSTEIESGNTVKSTKIAEKFTFKTTKESSKNLHTYKAYLEKVVDGDTIKVILDLGFKIRHRETLRLAQINAPESGTMEGDASTETLKNLLKDLPYLIIKTNKTDIYGRYVADVFLSKAKADEDEESLQQVANNGEYLSQKLLDLNAAKYLKV